MTQPLSSPAGSIFQTNGIIARKVNGKRHPISTRAFDSMKTAQENYVKPLDMPSGVVALENITGFPSYKRGTIHSVEPIVYTMPDGASFKFEAFKKGDYPSVQHFVYLQALIAHFAYHCVEDSVHIIHLNDVMNFLGRDTHHFDISPLRTACIRYARGLATYRNCWKEMDSTGTIVKKSYWHSNYISESSFVEGSDSDPEIAKSIEAMFSDKRKRHWVKFHPDIAKTIVNLARFNRNRIFSRYLFQVQDLDDDCKAIYCYLWSFGTLDINGKGKVISRTKETLMCGLSYLDSEGFDDWFLSKLAVLKTIGLLDFEKKEDQYWSFKVMNISKISHIQEYIKKPETVSTYQKRKQKAAVADNETSLSDDAICNASKKISSVDTVEFLHRAGFSVAEICETSSLGRSRVFAILKGLREHQRDLSAKVHRQEMKVLFERTKNNLPMDTKQMLQLMLAKDGYLDNPENVKVFIKRIVVSTR